MKPTISQKKLLRKMTTPMDQPPREPFLRFLLRGGNNPRSSGFMVFVLVLMWAFARPWYLPLIVTLLVGGVYVFGTWRNYNDRQA